MIRQPCLPRQAGINFKKYIGCVVSIAGCGIKIRNRLSLLYEVVL